MTTQFPFLSVGLEIVVLAENARRLRVKAENAELMAAAYAALAEDLASQGEEWRQVAADPASRADVKLIEEALGLYTNFSADASEFRSEAKRLEAKAVVLNYRADEFTREANQANRKYRRAAKQAAKYARLAAEAAAQKPVIRKMAKAEKRRETAEQRRARQAIANMHRYSPQAARVVAQAAAA